MFIDGQLYFDRQKDLALRAEREVKRKALIDKAKKQQEDDRKAGLARRTE